MIVPSDPFYGLKYINHKEIRQVKKVMKSKGLFRFDGPKLLRITDKLELNLSAMFDGNVLCVDNGTDALKLCLVANDIGVGDEVLVPCLSFIATASSVLTVGALPVFVDIDKTFNIDITKAESLITQNTKAILVVHFQGQPCNMDSILEFSKKHNLIVIEDVAQAFGVKYKDKYVGTIGDCSAFSFQSGKVITSGEGGLFYCKDNAKFEKAKRYADCGGERPYGSYPSWDREYTTFGENFKITEIQSAILIEQLKKVDKIYFKQNKTYNYLVDNLNKYTFRKVCKQSKIFPMSLCVVFESENQAQDFVQYVNQKGVEFSFKTGNFLPEYNTFKNKISWQRDNFPYTKEYQVNPCVKSLELLKRTCWLNLSAYLKKKHLKYLIKVMKDFINE